MIVLLLHKDCLIIVRAKEVDFDRFERTPGRPLFVRGEAFVAKEILLEIAADKTRSDWTFTVVPGRKRPYPGHPIKWTDFYYFGLVIALWRDVDGFVLTPMSGIPGKWWIPSVVGNLHIPSAAPAADVAAKILLTDEDSLTAGMRSR